jgi:hypothetical protein
MQQPPSVSFTDYPPPPPPPPSSRYPQPPPAYHQQQQQAPPPHQQPYSGPPLPPALRPPASKTASITSAGKFLLQYADSATPEQRSIASAVGFMNAVGGKAPVLATKGIGPFKSDRQLCLAYCLQAATFTGCRGNPGRRECHRMHLDCASPDSLPASALAPLVAWLRLDRVRALLAPTPAFLETHWWRQNP